VSERLLTILPIIISTLCRPSGRLPQANRVATIGVAMCLSLVHDLHPCFGFPKTAVAPHTSGDRGSLRTLSDCHSDKIKMPIGPRVCRWMSPSTLRAAASVACGAQRVRRISGGIEPRRRLGLMISTMARSVRPVAIRPWRSIARDTAPSVLRTASSHVRRAATCPSTCARNQGMQYPAMPTNPSYTDWAILNDRYLGRSGVFLNRHHATGFGADYVGCVSSINFSPPIGTIEAPRVIATMCRSIDAKLCPLGFNSPIYVRRIGERVPLWMPLKPHLIDQTSEFFDAKHRMFYCVGQLVAAGERVPYLSDKGIQLNGTSLSSDFQRRSTQPVSIHLLLRRGHPSICTPKDGRACLPL
jgi:hypothetical protein